MLSVGINSSFFYGILQEMLEQITDSSLYQHMGSTCQNGGCVREKKDDSCCGPLYLRGDGRFFGDKKEKKSNLGTAGASPPIYNSFMSMKDDIAEVCIDRICYGVC
jgi:hypothetical protein